MIGVAIVVQLATRVDDDQAEEFRETTKKLGLSTADALRMFVSSFNEYQGVPIPGTSSTGCGTVRE